MERHSRCLFFLLMSNNTLWVLSLIFPVDDAAGEPDELTVDRSYVKKKLEHGLTRIWQVCSQTLPFVLLSFPNSLAFYQVLIPLTALIFQITKSIPVSASLLRMSS